MGKALEEPVSGPHPASEASQLVISRSKRRHRGLKEGCPLVPQDSKSPLMAQSSPHSGRQAGLLCPGSHTGLGAGLGPCWAASHSGHCPSQKAWNARAL